jgi:hypothetical protein
VRACFGAKIHVLQVIPLPFPGHSDVAVADLARRSVALVVKRYGARLDVATSRWDQLLACCWLPEPNGRSVGGCALHPGQGANYGSFIVGSSREDDAIMAKTVAAITGRRYDKLGEVTRSIQQLLVAEISYVEFASCSRRSTLMWTQ